MDDRVDNGRGAAGMSLPEHAMNTSLYVRVLSSRRHRVPASISPDRVAVNHRPDFTIPVTATLQMPQMPRCSSPPPAPRFLANRRWYSYTILGDVSGACRNAPHDLKKFLNNALLPRERGKTTYFR
jgi:hypothetical protein